MRSGAARVRSIVNDEELDAIRIESTHTIDIETFVPRAIRSISATSKRPTTWPPEDKVAQEAFAVIRNSIARKENAVVALIRSKQTGQPAKIEQAPRPSKNVINLIDALRRSIGSRQPAGRAEESKPSKTSEERGARKDLRRPRSLAPQRKIRPG